MSLQQRSMGPRVPGIRSPATDWWKITAMGVFLAALIYLTFFYERSGTDELGLGPPIVTARVETPELDQELLRTVRDQATEERLLLEAKPLAHLLEKSLRVVPSVAKALGLPDPPIPVDRLRADPAAYRGAYLGYKGELKYLSPGMSGHPVDGYKIYEGWIETEVGEPILFRVSLVSGDVKVGDYVRVEGYFMKLRDSHRLPKAELAPLLVGPELYPDYADWEPIAALDKEILAEVDDGEFAAGQVRFTPDLEDSQDIPLWHLAGYAIANTDKWSFERWREVPALTTKDQTDASRNGLLERGTPMRLLGTFVMARTFAARPNPLGAEFWTVAWVQIRLNGKLIPVWVPGRIGDWQRHDAMEVRGYYFKRFVYENENSATAFTPLFVAAHLDGYERLPEHPMATAVKWIFGGIVLFVIGLFLWIGRRDRLTRTAHEQAMVERRRKRRRLQGAVVAGSQQV